MALFFNTFRKKIILTFSLILAAISVFIYFYFPSVIIEEQTKSLKNKANELAEITVYGISAAVGFRDHDALVEGIEPIVQDNNILYVVIHLGKSDSVYYAYNYRIASENDYLRVEGIGYRDNLFKIKKEILFEGYKEGDLYLGYSFDEINNTISRVRRNIAMISLLVFGIGIFAAWLMGGILVRPMVHLSEVAQHIAAGKHTERAEIDTKDEIGKLAASFNEMTDKLITTNKKLEKINEDLEKIVAERTKELVEAKEAAEESDRMKSIFLAQMSHEIRTPITTILSYLSLIKEEFVSKDCGNEDVAGFFNSIDKGVVRLLNTIDSILHMSQLQAGNYKPKYMRIALYRDVLINLINEFKIKAEQKGLSLELDVSDSEIYVVADKYSLTQVFANLIDNSIKYTNKGYVKVYLLKKSADKITMVVEDSGIGISEEFLKIIFSPFTQEEMGYTRSYDGTGLGMALVKNYCEINNIDISIKSKKGEGTIVFLDIKIEE
ncbi:histidine kinase [Melioribacter roseus P3M-2]|uniref:histidine kinase n=1 Tax=Melioribacter roseus (strain DSM 23840 / JCM 17771 / VKM B-2668 / P3M-2) TaxID=1191523 RepID=I6YRS5_MELRP|nr:HAMP domain-containing sensor histidine kinase [Melioribacter roseus]AFN73247.1 histidine kinase [Melioribacter roseus P3M-2]